MNNTIQDTKATDSGLESAIYLGNNIGKLNVTIAKLCSTINGNQISNATTSSRLRANDSSTFEVVNQNNLSAENNGATFSNSGTKNRDTACQ